MDDLVPVTCNQIQELVAKMTPQETGYCAILAKVADNPGYDVNAKPPAKPAKSFAQYGKSCR